MIGVASPEEENEEQKAAIAAAVTKAVDAHFDDEQRHRYSRRLEENALVLLSTDRDRQARITAATCLAIRDSNTKPGSIPFLIQLFAKIAGNLPAPEILQTTDSRPVE